MGKPGIQIKPTQERAGPGEHVIQRLLALLRRQRYDDYRCELAQAELTGEVSEFYALSFQAILAMTEGSEFAVDYLEMAEVVVGSPYERVVMAENRRTYDLLRCNPFAAAARCAETLGYLHQNETLWRNLLIMLCRLGDIASIEAALRSLTEHEYAPRCVREVARRDTCDCS